ncbi:SRPBCC family protein [Mesorhizobium helmanticense]|uniref:Polyketide cyclase n=1 Tax=Mesorhizobium helmanticense TaxID=1776423 RepID=A0A2T4ILY8_9HYPH|nr:SRPBCC family protein [Mesorhizobium helmanticense]PTE06661.1 hypothetical protein C9427_30505 [Mesorhizobium helmanticense]
MTFVVTQTYLSEASPETIWATLTDLEAWPSWDVRLERVTTDGPAKTGRTYRLTPVAGNEIEIKIISAERNKLHDVTKVEFGSIETERSVVATNGGSLVTQTMRADIVPEFAHTFSKVFWDVWSQGIIDSTKALANAHTKSRTPYATPVDVERLIAAHRNVA